MPVRGPAVGLDDDAVAGPQEVDLVTEDEDVRAGLGELRGAERRAEGALQFAAGGFGVVVVGAGDEPGDQGFCSGSVLRCAAQLRDRLARGGDGDAVPGGGVEAVSGCVCADAVALPWGAVGERDVDQLRHRGDEGPEVGGGLVGDGCVRARGEEGGDHAAAVGHGLVADRVDALMEADEAAARRLVVDLVARVAERGELCT